MLSGRFWAAWEPPFEQLTQHVGYDYTTLLATDECREDFVRERDRADKLMTKVLKATADLIAAKEAAAWFGGELAALKVDAAGRVISATRIRQSVGLKIVSISSGDVGFHGCRPSQECPSATDALALPLRESGIRLCACPVKNHLASSAAFTSGHARALWACAPGDMRVAPRAGDTLQSE